jgi:uncharacterized protein (DUF1778 family)
MPGDKTARFEMRIAPDDLWQLQYAADQIGLGLADWARSVLLREAQATIAMAEAAAKKTPKRP